jgi:hypothetical protein
VHINVEPFIRGVLFTIEEIAMTYVFEKGSRAMDSYPDDESRWQAVVARDPAADGTFRTRLRAASHPSTGRTSPPISMATVVP